MAGVSAGFDQAVLGGLRGLGRRKRPRGPADPEDRIEALGGISRAYPPSRLFFRDPLRIEPEQRRRKDYVDLRWPSAHPAWLEGLQGWVNQPTNVEARVRLYTGEEPRPVVILLHGYLAGWYPTEVRLWPVRELRQRGYDVALFVLPFHAVRGEGIRVPRFPSSDPRRTNELFRQTMGELRDLVAWLRRRGHSEVGAWGMSLGGYTASLLATVEPELGFLVPVIPLVCLADYAFEKRLVSERVRPSLRAAHECIAPLDRPPLIEGDRVFVIGARGDRITPISHAEKLSAHFGARLHRWPGSHLLQIGRRKAWEEALSFMDSLR